MGVFVCWSLECLTLSRGEVQNVTCSRYCVILEQRIDKRGDVGTEAQNMIWNSWSAPNLNFRFCYFCQRGYAFGSMCLFTGQHDIWKICEQILVKLGGKLGHGTRNTYLVFGVDPDPGVDPGIF